MSAPLMTLVLTNTWSIRFFVLPPGEVNVCLCISLCGIIVPVTTRSLSPQMSKSLSPLSFLSPAPWLPIIFS